MKSSKLSGTEGVGENKNPSKPITAAGRRKDQDWEGEGRRSGPVQCVCKAN